MTEAVIWYFFKKPVTQQFPEERWSLPERYRGFVHNDVPRCTACMLCAKACPSDCIYIEMEGKGKERKMARYAIDYNKCIWCSLCCEPCPTNCITMSHDYDHSVYLRDRLVYEFVDEAVVPYKVPKKAKPEAAEKPAAVPVTTATELPATNPEPETPEDTKPEGGDA